MIYYACDKLNRFFSFFYSRVPLFFSHTAFKQQACQNFKTIHLKGFYLSCRLNNQNSACFFYRFYDKFHKIRGGIFLHFTLFAHIRSDFLTFIDIFNIIKWKRRFKKLGSQLFYGKSFSQRAQRHKGIEIFFLCGHCELCARFFLMKICHCNLWFPVNKLRSNFFWYLVCFYAPKWIEYTKSINFVNNLCVFF